MIPRIDVRKSFAAGVRTGELHFPFEPEQALIDIPYVSFSSPAEADLSYEVFGDGEVEVHGSVAFSLKGLCSRCLAEAETRVRYEAEGVFVPHSPKDDEYVYSNGFIDLNEFLRDAVMFALPARLLCERCEHEQ